MEKALRVLGENVHVVDTGKNTESDPSAALVLHGNSLSARSWHPQLEAKELEPWRLISIDLPGHGRSSPSPEPEARYCLRGYGEVVAEVIRRLELKRVCLVGHSMGAHIAMEIAPEIPEVCGLFVFGAPPLSGVEDMARGFRETELVGYIGAGELTREQASEFARGMFGPNIEPPNWAVDAILATDERARPNLAARLTPEEFVDELAALRRAPFSPALVHAGFDALVSEDYLRSLDVPLWRGGVQRIDGTGHSPQWENPDAFNALLRAYLSEHLPPAR